MAIYEKFYTDNDGQQYRVALTYERDRRPRGYYLSIFPVEISDTGSGFYSMSYTMDATFFDNRVYTLLREVSRACKSGKDIAMNALYNAVDVYFTPRGIAHVGNMAEAIAYAEGLQNGR